MPISDECTSLPEEVQSLPTKRRLIRLSTDPMLLQYQQRCVGEHSILPASSEMQVREVQNVHSFQVHGPSSIRRQAVGNENVGYFSKKCGEKQRTVGICIRLVKKAICHHCGAGSGDVNAAAFKAEHVPPELCRTFSE